MPAEGAKVAARPREEFKNGEPVTGADVPTVTMLSAGRSLTVVVNLR